MRKVTGLDARPTHLTPVPLSVVAALVDIRPADMDPPVTGVSLSSRAVRPGDLYAALPGGRTHGARFAADVAEAGAVAFLTDPVGASECAATGLPVLVTDRPRGALGAVSALVYGRPAERVTTIGVTGTQGKTTTTHLVDSAAGATGRTSAVVGTIGTRLAGHAITSALTTPEAPDLHALFAVMVEQGVDVCAVEVSSHALVQGRVDGVVFDVAVFLNLGRDHLDFHADIEDYFAAKASLFTPARARAAVINIDDAYGRRLVNETSLQVTTFGVGEPAVARGAHWVARDVDSTPSGSSFDLAGPDGASAVVTVSLPGAFNVSNAVAALVAMVVVGLPLAEAVAGLASAPGIPGRMETVDVGQDFAALVDYAHKPDALEAVLSALRPTTEGRLVLVIGAGGDRDDGKRLLMGEIAARLADLVIVTDDNPRSEDPTAIRAALLDGAAAGAAEVEEIGDRRAAIARAVDLARPGDCVVVAGKGHERGQEVGGVVHPFDDRDILAEEIDRVVHA